MRQWTPFSTFLLAQVRRFSQVPYIRKDRRPETVLRVPSSTCGTSMAPSHEVGTSSLLPARSLSGCSPAFQPVHTSWGSTRSAADESTPTSSPPAVGEIHEVITLALEKGDWRKAVQLFTGALKLHCIPLTQTYKLVLQSTVERGGAGAAVSFIDSISPNRFSMGAFYDLAIQTWLSIYAKREGLNAKTTPVEFLPSVSVTPISCDGKDLIFLVEQSVKRNVVPSSSIRENVWRSLISEGLRVEALEICRDILQMDKPILPALTSKASECPFTSKFALGGSVSLTEVEVRLLMQAASVTGDIDSALMLGKHFLERAGYHGVQKNGSTKEENYVTDGVESPSQLTPSPTVIASFGTAFFKHYADHGEAFEKHMGAWLSGIFWLRRFPSSDVAAELSMKMIHVIETHTYEGSAMPLFFLEEPSGLEKPRKNILSRRELHQIVQWCHSNIPRTCHYDLDSTVLRQMVHVIHAIRLKHRTIELDSLIETLRFYFLQKQKGENTREVSPTALTATCIIVSLAFPSVALSIWKIFPSAWWWKEDVGEGEKSKFAGVFFTRWILDLARDEDVGLSMPHSTVSFSWENSANPEDFLLLAEALVSKLSEDFVKTRENAEDILALSKELQKEILSWAGEGVQSLPIAEEDVKNKIKQCVVRLIAQVSSPLTNDVATYASLVSDSAELGLLAIDLFLANPNLFKMTSEDIIALLSMEAENMKDQEKRNVWSVVLAYFFHLERRCELSKSTNRILESLLRSGKHLFFAGVYAHMMFTWDGRSDTYRCVLLPLLMDQMAYYAALETIDSYILPSGIEALKEEEQEEVKAFTYVCRAELCYASLEKALVLKNTALLEKVIEDIRSSYLSLSPAHRLSLDVSPTRALLRCPMMEKALLELLEHRKFHLVKAFVEAFYPSAKRLFPFGAPLLLLDLHIYFYIEAFSNAPSSEEKMLMTDFVQKELANFQERMISSSATCFPMRYFILAAMGLHRIGVKAYSFLTEVFKTKQRWEALFHPSLSTSSEPKEGANSFSSENFDCESTENVFKAYRFSPSLGDLAVLRGASYIVRGVVNILKHEAGEWIIDRGCASDLYEKKKMKLPTKHSEHSSPKNTLTKNEKLSCHDLCHMASFLIPMIESSADVLCVASLLHEWRFPEYQPTELNAIHPVKKKLLGAGSSRVALEMLHHCSAHRLVIPLLLIEVATESVYLKPREWAFIGEVLPYITFEPASSYPGTSMHSKRYTDLVCRVLLNLSTVGTARAALDVYGSINPLLLHFSNTAGTSNRSAAQKPNLSASVENILALAVKGSAEDFQSASTANEAIPSPPISLAASRSFESPRRAILDRLSTNQPRQALNLLLLGLERRRDHRQGTSQPTFVYTEDYFDVDLILRVLNAIAVVSRWETTLRVWLKVHELAPFIPWQMASGKNCTLAFSNLLMAMSEQGASAVLMIKVVQLGVVELGLPQNRVYTDLLCSAIASQKVLSIGERIYCKQLLNDFKNQKGEQQIVNTMLRMSGLISLRNSNTPSSAQPFPSALPWMNEQPVLEEADISTLALVAPLILFATTHQLERLSEKFFARQWLSFELKPLLFLYRQQIIRQIDFWNRNSSSPLMGNENQLDSEWIDECCMRHTLLVRLSEFVRHYPIGNNRPSASLSSHPAAEKQRMNISWLQKMAKEVFASFISLSTAQVIWERVQSRVLSLHNARWSPVVESELCDKVWELGGKTPRSLCTSPHLSKRHIEHYWSVYRTILVPELVFDAPELCCLAYYNPEISALYKKFETQPEKYHTALWELAAVIQTAHFRPDSIPESEYGSLFRRPRSIREIYAVLLIARKSLNQLFHKLEMDARSTRYFFKCYGGPRHNHTYLKPNIALNILHSLYDLPLSQNNSVCASSESALSISSVFTFPSRLDLLQSVCGLGLSSFSRSFEDSYPCLRSFWLAVLRDKEEQALWRTSGVEGAGSTPKKNCKDDSSFDVGRWECVKHLVEKACGTTAELPLRLLRSSKEEAEVAFHAKHSTKDEYFVLNQLGDIRDPVIRSLTSLHVYFATKKREVPKEVSAALLEQVKSIMICSSKKSYAEDSQSVSAVFTLQDEAYASRKMFLDVVAFCTAFDAFSVFQYINAEHQRQFFKLIGPSVDEIQMLPSKNKTEKHKKS